MATKAEHPVSAVVNYALAQEGIDFHTLLADVRIPPSTYWRNINKGQGRRGNYTAIEKRLGLPATLLWALKEGDTATVDYLTRDLGALHEVAMRRLSAFTLEAEAEEA